MTIDIERVTPQIILQYITDFSTPDLQWLAKQLDLILEEPPLPDSATMDEAIDLFLADQCSLGRAAELAGVTRWDVMDTMKERGIPIIVHSHSTVEEIDAIAEELEAQAAVKEFETGNAVEELEAQPAL